MRYDFDEQNIQDVRFFADRRLRELLGVVCATGGNQRDAYLLMIVYELDRLADAKEHRQR